MTAFLVIVILIFVLELYAIIGGPEQRKAGLPDYIGVAVLGGMVLWAMYLLFTGG